MCVMHTDTALSCILLNNTQHTPVNSLSTLTILWFERKALIQTSVKFALHCTNNNNIICALNIFFSHDYYSYSSYPVKTTDPSAEKWVPISYKVSLLQLSVGEEVLDLKLWCCYRQLSLFPMATISSPAIWHSLLPMMWKAGKLHLKQIPVTTTKVEH